MDRKIIQKLFERYQREIYLYLYSMCGSREVAEDLMQETFLKAILALPDSHSNIRAWLYKVARNLYYNAVRKSSREMLFSEEEQGMEGSVKYRRESPGVSNEGSPLDVLLQNERQRMLMKAIEALENPYREIVVLQYFGGMQLNQIAGLVGTSPGNVRVMASRARKKMKEYLEENGYELS